MYLYQGRRVVGADKYGAPCAERMQCLAMPVGSFAINRAFRLPVTETLCDGVNVPNLEWTTPSMCQHIDCDPSLFQHATAHWSRFLFFRRRSMLAFVQGYVSLVEANK